MGMLVFICMNMETHLPNILATLPCAPAYSFGDGEQNSPNKAHKTINKTSPHKTGVTTQGGSGSARKLAYSPPSPLVFRPRAPAFLNPYPA